MQNQTVPPQNRSFYEPDSTGEQIVEQSLSTPGSVIAPQNTDTTYAQPIIKEDDVLESDYIEQQRSISQQSAKNDEPSVPQSFSPPSPRGKYALGSRPVPALLSVAVLLLVALFGGSYMVISKINRSVNPTTQPSIATQTFNITGLTASKGVVDEIQAKQRGTQLIVKGGIVATEKIGIYNNQFLGQLQIENITSDQSYVLPDSSGTICLDSNNCNYIQAGAVVTSIGGRNGQINIGGGLSLQGNTLISSVADPTILTSVNDISGSIIISGVTNQTLISTSGNVVNISTVQDIAVSSSPTFKNLAVVDQSGHPEITWTNNQGFTTSLIANAFITANRSVSLPDEDGVICLQNSSNCGFATGGADAFLQDGNSFGATAVLGTNDNNNLVLETNNISRVTVDTTGNVGISAVSNGAKLYVPYLTGDVGQPSSGLFSQSALVVVGDSTNTNNGLIAIDGESYSGVGVQGVSSTGIGVLGYSNSSAGLINGAGVLGINMNAGSAAVSGMGGLWASGSGVGVYGYAVSSYGVEGQSTAGISGYFQAASSCGLFGGCSDINTSPTLVARQLGSLTANLFEVQDSSSNALFSIGYNGHTAIGNNAAVDDCSLLSGLLGSVTCYGVLSIQETVTDFSKDYTSGINNQVVLSSGNGTTVNSTVQANLTSVITANDDADYNIVRGEVAGIVHQGSGTINFAEATHFSVSNYGLGSIGFAKGLQADVVNASVGDILSASGLDANVVNVSGGTISTAGAIYANSGNSGAGSIGTNYGLHVATGNTGLGSITTNYGINIQSAANSGGGSILDNYGLFIQDQSAPGITNSFNIYSAGSGRNLLQGHTEIGGVSDVVQLQIKGNTSQSVNLQEWQDATGYNLVEVAANGTISLNNGDAAIYSGGCGAGLCLYSGGQLFVSTGQQAASGVVLDSHIEIGYGSAKASSGDVRMLNNSTINARNAADTADITLIGTNSSDQVVLGGQNSSSVIIQPAGNVVATFGTTGAVLLQNSVDSTAALTVKTNAGNNVLSVDTLNSVTALNSINSDAVLGPELVTSQAFNNATYWTTCNSGAGGWTGTATQTTHNAGNSNPCISTAANFTVVAGATYQVSFTVSGVTPGVSQLYTKIGNGNFAFSNDNGSYTVVLRATNTNGLQFTSDSPWSGTISNISVKMLTTTVNPVLKVQNSSGVTALEVRVNSDTTNSFVGLNAGRSNIDGTGNTAFGSDVLGLNTSGYSNTGIGSSALALNSIGFSNTAVGNYALGNNTIGSSNTAIGSSALAGNITGIGNTALGESALATNQTGSGNTNIGTWAGYNNVTGSFNTVIGANAGFQASQTDFNTTTNLSSQTIIGAFAQGYLSNSFILGGQGTDQVAGYGFGTGSPTNFLSVTPKAYNNGSVSLSSGSGTVTGGGTTFTANMVGMEIFIASGDGGATTPYKGTITGFTDTTHITVSPVATMNYTSRSYYILYPGLQVTTAGKVGVGTLSPLSQLQVVIPDGGSTKALVVNNSTSTGNIAEFQDNGTSVMSVVDGGAAVFQNTTNTTSGFIVKDSGGSNNVIRADTSNSRVGIGTGTGAPSYTLDVLSGGADGTTVAQFKNAGATSCTVQPGGTGFACSSDARLKTNVVSIGDASAVIKQLRGVTFNWISNPDGEIQSGFIAQELEQILPSAVSTDANGYKVANYTSIIPYLVGAAQQQDIRVTNLEDQHQNQHQQITNITNQITQIQQNTVNQTQNSNFIDLNVSGSALVTNLTVTGNTTVAELKVTSNATIAHLKVTGDAEFLGNINLSGHLTGNNDTRGSITVPSGQAEASYSFAKPYDSEPNVILTPKDTFAPSYRVTATTGGFTVYFETPAATDISMNYQVQQ